MPQHKSAAKRVRQTEKRRLRNRLHRSRVRTMIKELRATTSRAEAEPKLSVVKALLDRMATRRLLHPNAAAHAKSQLERFVRTLA
jgi:small subunit ribosomal protein S20